jgi:hypothetical protein
MTTKRQPFIYKMSMLASMGIILFCRFQAYAEEPATIELNLAMTLSSTAVKDVQEPHENQLAILLALDDGTKLELPMLADTSVTADDKPRGEAILVLRDGNYSRALLKPDLSKIPDKAKVDRADFRFRIGWREREESGKLAFYKMLTKWTEDATGRHADGTSESAWKLQAGIDFEKTPFATYDIAVVKTGTVVVPGFEDALNQWLQDGSSNFGFLMTFNGKAMQINVNSRESKPPASKGISAIGLGGKDDNRAILKMDYDILDRVLLSDDDLLEATATIFVKLAAAASGQKLVVYQFSGEQSHEDETQLSEIVRVDLPSTTPITQVKIPDLGSWLRRVVKNPESVSDALLLVIESSGEQSVVNIQQTGRLAPQMAVTLKKHKSHSLFENVVRPKEGIYARVDSSGNLTYGGQRLRLWGVNRHASPNLNIVDRLCKTGFNALRLWPGAAPYDVDSARQGRFFTPQEGATPPMDQYDRFVAEMKKRGMFVFAPLFESRSLLQEPQLKEIVRDDSFLRDLNTGSDDWEAWREAVLSKKLSTVHAMYFDERLGAVFKRHASNILEHVNPYTGKRYAEEETIAVWQVVNENAFVYRVLEKGTGDWPEYFQDKLQTRWNSWLKERYRDDAGLIAAWGKPGDGESLEQGSVALEPTLLNRSKFSEVRGNDVVAFIVDLAVAFNRDFHEYCRTFAPDGVGVNVVPFVFDCQYRPSIPWLASQALPGDAVAISTYEWGLTSKLNAPPGIYVLDGATVEGKATFVYETNTASVNPYRAEFPLRVAALASRQDWDGVFFHIYHTPDERIDVYTPDERYLIEKLPYIRADHYWSGTHFSADTALGASLAIAGRIFQQCDIPPAPAPVVTHVSDSDIRSFRHFNGINQRADSFGAGSRLRFGGEVEKKTTVTTKTEECSPVIYEPENGRMIIDTPTVKAYVGKTDGNYAFSDGVVVGDFTQPFVAWGIFSTDGKPLTGKSATSSAIAVAMFNAINTGFKIDMTLARQKTGFIPPLQLASATRSFGRAPIVVDKVGWTLWFPTALKGSLDSFDFALRRLSTNDFDGDNRIAGDSDREVFLYRLDISGRGEDMHVPDATDTSTASSGPLITDAGKMTKISTLWNPLPELGWADDYGLAHQKMRDGNFLRSGISGGMLSGAADASFTVFDAEIIFDKPANIEISFLNGEMARILVTFTQPPALSEALADYEEKLGQPIEKKVSSNPYETSRARWMLASLDKKELLEVELVEDQGTMGLSYIRKINETKKQ